MNRGGFAANYRRPDGRDGEDERDGDEEDREGDTEGREGDTDGREGVVRGVDVAGREGVVRGVESTCGVRVTTGRLGLEPV